MVVAAFGHQTPLGNVDNHNQRALLAESAQRLLWLYQRCLPAVVSEARFDVGKLLQTFATQVDDADDDHEDEADSARRLLRVHRFLSPSFNKGFGQILPSGLARGIGFLGSNFMSDG